MGEDEEEGQEQEGEEEVGGSWGAQAQQARALERCCRVVEAVARGSDLHLHLAEASSSMCVRHSPALRAALVL